MTTQGERIRRIRDARGWNQVDLANAVGVNQATISKWERDLADPSDAHRTKLARLGNIDAAALRYGGTLPGGLPLVPIVGYVGAGEAVIVIDDHSMGAALDYVQAPPGTKNDNLIALRIRGDSMRPLRDGWLVFYGRDQDGVPETAINQVCVCQLPDGRLLVKELRRGLKVGRYTLHSWAANADPIEDVTVLWAAPVAAIVPG